jgi:hypothetical protein
MYGVENAHFKSYETDKFIDEVLKEQSPIDKLNQANAQQFNRIMTEIAAEKLT